MSEDKVGYELTLNKERINGAVRLATQIVAEQIRDLHPAEALFAFAEIVGRVVAAQEGSPVVHNELIRMAEKHIRDTVKAAYSSQGKSSGAII